MHINESGDVNICWSLEESSESHEDFTNHRKVESSGEPGEITYTLHYRFDFYIFPHWSPMNMMKFVPNLYYYSNSSAGCNVLYSVTEIYYLDWIKPSPSWMISLYSKLADKWGSRPTSSFMLKEKLPPIFAEFTNSRAFTTESYGDLSMKPMTSSIFAGLSCIL